MTEYLTEQEQIELLKNWIKQYSAVILTGLLIAAMSITGWRYWQQRQINTLNRASAIYDEMLTKRVQNDPEATVIQAQKLYSHYPKTVYGQFATLMLARAALEKNNLAEAEKQFNIVIRQSNVASLRQIARLRLARLLISENKYQDAIKILHKVDDKNFNGLTNEIRGDAYLAMRNIAKAREMYQQALADLPNAETIRPLLQMKYDNLASNPS